MLKAAPASRFLSTGYVVASTTYRSRDVDPQSPVSANDVAAALEYVRRLRDSIGLIGLERRRRSRPRDRDNPSQDYTQEYRTFTQRKLATLRSLILASAATSRPSRSRSPPRR
jgi:hypothetical protein